MEPRADLHPKRVGNLAGAPCQSAQGNDRSVWVARLEYTGHPAINGEQRLRFGNQFVAEGTCPVGAEIKPHREQRRPGFSLSGGIIVADHPRRGDRPPQVLLGAGATQQGRRDGCPARISAAHNQNQP